MSFDERRLITLFAQYPDIEPSIEDQCYELSSTAATHSSPSSAPPENDDNRSCRASNSTAQTTPLRPPPGALEASSQNTDISQFERRLTNAVLPSENIAYFLWLARSISDSGQTLFSPNSTSPSQTQLEQLSQVVTNVYESVHYSSEQVNGHIFRLTHLKSLMAFSCTPSEKYLWSTYRQRAKLIIEQSALPCRTELDLIEQLAHIYDAYLYNPASHQNDEAHLGESLPRLFHELYNAIWTWFHRYSTWSSSMKEIRQCYMLPLMNAIISSQQAQNEIKQDRKGRTKALAAILDSKSTDSLQSNTKTIDALNLSTRRTVETLPRQIRTKTRYKREHTL